ncbi:MAG: hypothetical protein FWE16_00370 [Firmicutes bacterium]|nr:hypothetical protein [Bacillota bacterium]
MEFLNMGVDDQRELLEYFVKSGNKVDFDLLASKIISKGEIHDVIRVFVVGASDPEKIGFNEYAFFESVMQIDPKLLEGFLEVQKHRKSTFTEEQLQKIDSFIYANKKTDSLNEELEKFGGVELYRGKKPQEQTQEQE